MSADNLKNQNIPSDFESKVPFVKKNKKLYKKKRPSSQEKNRSQISQNIGGKMMRDVVF